MLETTNFEEFYKYTIETVGEEELTGVLLVHKININCEILSVDLKYNKHVIYAYVGKTNITYVLKIVIIACYMKPNVK